MEGLGEGTGLRVISGNSAVHSMVDPAYCPWYWSVYEAGACDGWN
jgi:hypothetical protein